MIKHLTLMLILFLPAFTTQAQISNLVAETYTEFRLQNFAIVHDDSTHYTYSNGRTGKRDPLHYYSLGPTFILSDDCYTVTRMDDTTWKPAWVPKRLWKRNYNSNNRTTRFVYLEWNKALKQFDSTGDEYYTYNGMNDTADITLYLYSTSGKSLTSRTSYTYQSGRVHSITTEKWNANKNSYQNYYSRFFIYDGAGNLILDSTNNANTSNWVPRSLIKYIYSGNNKIADSSFGYNGSKWIPNNVIHFTYNSNNNIIYSEEYQMSLDTLLHKVDSSIYAYNTAGYLQTRKRYMLSNLPYYFLDNYTYDANGRLISSCWGLNNDITSQHDTSYLNEYKYDALDNCVQLNVMTYSATHLMQSYTRYNYYYELVWPTSIAASPVTDFKLYPVPAVGMLNVRAQWKEAQAFTVSICDMQGRVLRSWKEDTCVLYTRSIALDGFAKGNYILTLQGKERVSKVFAVE